MKHSNKILWSGITMIFLVAVSGIVILNYWNREYREHNSLIHNWGTSNKQTIKGNNNIITRSPTVGNFIKMKAAGDFEINVKPSNSSKVELKTDANIMQHIVTRVNDGELELTTDKPLNLLPTQKIIVEISTPQMQEIQLGGSSHLTILTNDIPSFNLTLGGQNSASIKGNITHCVLNLSGQSQINFDIQKNKSMEITNAGNGEINLTGATENLKINNGGYVKLGAKYFTAKDVTINGAGETHVNVRATDNITLTTVGASRLEYYGNPKIHNHSMGDIKINKVSD